MNSISTELWPLRKSLVRFLRHQKAWSLRNFGPGRRTIGITKHIEKEVLEVREKPDDLTEWLDIAILAFDGAWRTGASPEQIEKTLWAIQQRNFLRKYPKPVSEDEPSEHDRTLDNA